MSTAKVQHKYIAIADNGHETRTWTILAEGALPARAKAERQIKKSERLVVIAKITWEVDDG